MDKYIMLITYSFDSDYIAILCDTEKEAKEWLEKYLHEEILTIKNESEYEPIVKRHTDNDVELVYEEENLVSDSSDRAYYKIIKTGNETYKNVKFYYTELEKEKKK